MPPKIKFFKLWKPVERENAARYMLISLLSFVATVTFVRTFLVFTGYPQLGGGPLHIAHVLWGGLILYIAAILPLIYLNPRVFSLVAILSGVGAGLFIDEVGKFITSQYDYFYPSAAPIMYVFFLLILILVIMINRSNKEDGRAELLQALEIVQEQLYRPLEAREKARFASEISAVKQNDPDPIHVALARQLLEFAHADERVLPETMPAWWLRIVFKLESWLVEIRLRRVIEIGFLITGLSALKNPLRVWLQRAIPGSAITAYLNSHFGRQIEAVNAPALFNMRLSLEVLVGVLLLAAAVLLFMGKRNQAINIGFFSLLASLVVVDMLLFYFEQFSSVLVVLLHFLVLFAVMQYRRKYLKTTDERLDIKT